jgi:hypothetical protein
MVYHYVIVFLSSSSSLFAMLCSLLLFDGIVTGIFPIYTYKQVRVSGFGGWFLLRLSLHDPVLPLNIEVDMSSRVCLSCYGHYETYFY